MDAVDRFAVEVELFRTWAMQDSDQAEWAARVALIRLTRLYLAAIDLPPHWSEELAGQPNAVRVEDEECNLVAAACRRLPFDFYGKVFDPLPIPPEETVIGSLTDDISDIYRDLVTELRAYEAGRRAQAIWEWGFGLKHHWGDHATGAIRALHCWLASHAPDHLAAGGNS